MFRRKRYVQPKINTREKSWSLAFYASIWIIFACIAGCVYSLGVLLQQIDFSEFFATNQKKLFAVFFTFLVSALTFSTKMLPSFRTLLHELKHAAVVILSGNRMQELKVYKDIGHVGYSVYQNKIRFMPFILLAPYHFPLLSFPALSIAITMQYFSPVHWPAAVLGACLAGDLVIAYRDLHPHQSDIKRIFGGRLVAYAFIFGANILWILICLIWVIAGSDGYAQVAIILEEQVLNLPEYFPQVRSLFN